MPVGLLCLLYFLIAIIISFSEINPGSIGQDPKIVAKCIDSSESAWQCFDTVKPPYENAHSTSVEAARVTYTIRNSRKLITIKVHYQELTRSLMQIEQGSYLLIAVMFNIGLGLVHWWLVSWYILWEDPNLQCP